MFIVVTLLDKHIKEFLELYHNFRLVDSNRKHIATLQGTITIVDENNQIWSDYDIRIEISHAYPYTIPSIYEESKLIERDWEFHISKEGKCCLDIHHSMLLKRRKGISLINFYQNVIYPFFANHQYKVNEGSYANGEYKHFEKGIIQYYEEELDLTDRDYILKLIDSAILGTKYARNNTCTICGSPKFKKCCLPKINKLTLFGKDQLKTDYGIFASLSIN
ncbi:hypothetical protein [Aequorivita antarctica]|uniref:hypothetical protein n=1 Tax=Aequorivita antarctica TaxID=153266 RepID=UPI000DBBEA88|nr:hypothetical protein [Aequorivita antarctica]SRX76371.1 hypothetical protein AEQU3_03371 [Aequorivita antarctica]